MSSLGSARSGADVLEVTRTGPQHASVDGKARGEADYHLGSTYLSRDLVTYVILDVKTLFGIVPRTPPQANAPSISPVAPELTEKLPTAKGN